MTHDRTSMINAFFILIIVLRHINQRIVPFHGVDLWYQSYFDSQTGQSIVSTFFFFSGYGIMKSILKKREVYVKELMSKRFVRLYINTAICCAISCFVYMMTHLTPSEAMESFAKTMLGLGGYWFILMTLGIYAIVWLSFKVCGLQKLTMAIVVAFVLVSLFCALLIPVKPMWWLDTELCFPCGMLMARYLTQIEDAIRRIRVPIIVVGVCVSVVGWTMMKYHMLPFHVVHEKFKLLSWLPDELQVYVGKLYHVLVYPLTTGVWVLGLLWSFASIQWQKVPSFLVWLGGPAVFYIFVLHFIPLRIVQAGRLSGPYPVLSSDINAVIVTEPTGWGLDCPELCIVGVVLCSLLLAYMAHLIIPRIDKLIFKR